MISFVKATVGSYVNYKGDFAFAITKLRSRKMKHSMSREHGTKKSESPIRTNDLPYTGRVLALKPLSYWETHGKFGHITARFINHYDTRPSYC